MPPRKGSKIPDIIHADEWGPVPEDRPMTRDEMIERFLRIGYSRKAAEKMVNFVKGENDGQG